jgi:hypothetical protein
MIFIVFSAKFFQAILRNKIDPMHLIFPLFEKICFKKNEYRIHFSNLINKSLQLNNEMLQGVIDEKNIYNNLFLSITNSTAIGRAICNVF